MFSGVSESSNGFDTIKGFESGEDTLQFSLTDVNDAISGNYDLEKGALGEDNFASNQWGQADDKDDYFVYNETTGVLSFDANGSKGYHDGTLLAQLVGAPHLRSERYFPGLLSRTTMRTVFILFTFAWKGE